jgi:hypothetical protein
MAQVAITGNTYPVKDRLKALGAKWDADRRCWTITDRRLDEARKIVAGAPQQAATPGRCLKCKGPVKEPYKICYGCKQQASGKCVNCGDPLNDWERRHGVKRCSDCRDGGGNAHGGQSYYDRNGNFVLGDED